MRVPEPRGLARYEQIAGEGQLQGAGDAVSVDAGNGGLGELFKAVDRLGVEVTP
jgi:hypothetical protein